MWRWMCKGDDVGDIGGEGAFQVCVLEGRCLSRTGGLAAARDTLEYAWRLHCNGGSRCRECNIMNVTNWRPSPSLPLPAVRAGIAATGVAWALYGRDMRPWIVLSSVRVGCC